MAPQEDGVKSAMSGKAWNSSLPSRKEPMRRGKVPWSRKPKQKEWRSGTTKQRKPMRKVSKSRAQETARYLAIRKEFLREHTVCGACLARDITPGVPTQIHHSRGRIKRLLCETRFWIAVCAPCHEFIHGNPAKARSLGLLAEASEFDVYPKE